MYIVTHIENHPDKELTVVGVYSTEEKAEAAVAKCKAESKYNKERWYCISERELDIVVDIPR